MKPLKQTAIAVILVLVPAACGLFTANPDGDSADFKIGPLKGKDGSAVDVEVAETVPEYMKDLAKFKKDDSSSACEIYIEDYKKDVDALMALVSAENIHFICKKEGIEALGKLGDSRAIPVLRKVLLEGGGFIQEEIAEVLPMLGGLEAYEALTQALEKTSESYVKAKREQSLEIAKASVRAAKNPKAPIDPFGEEDNKPLESVSEKVYDLAETLSGLQVAISKGKATAVYPLAKTLETAPSATLQWVAKSLVDIGDPSIPALLEAADSKRDDTRRWALWALVRLEVPESVQYVRRSLKDKDPEIRLIAVNGFSKIAEAGETDALQPLLKDPDFAVRFYTETVLKEMTHAK